MCALLVGLPDVTGWSVWASGRVAADRDLDRAGDAGLLWRRCARSRPPGGRAGRPAGVRPAGPAGVAQAAVALPGVPAGVDRAGPADRVEPVRDDDAGGPVGHAAGRPARPLGERGRRRSRLRLAHGDGRRRAFGDPLIDDPDRFGEVTAVGPGRDAVRSDRRVPPPAVVDPDRRRRHRAAARHRGRPRQQRAVRAGSPLSPRRGGPPSPGRRWICRPPTGGVRHDAARRRPGRRPVPRRPRRQHCARRVPPAGAERDARASGPQGPDPLYRAGGC
jgi:hypothetical protein